MCFGPLVICCLCVCKRFPLIYIGLVFFLLFNGTLHRAELWGGRIDFFFFFIMLGPSIHDQGMFLFGLEFL